MEAAQVIDKILAQAKEQASRIKNAGQDEQAVEQKDADGQLVEYKKQTEILAEQAGKDRKSRLLATARMDIAKEYLAEKRNILDKVFEQAREQLQNLGDEDYRKLMTDLMLKAVETGDEEVIVDNNETRIDSGLIEQIKSKLSADGKGNLILSDEKQPLKGGFVLKRGKINNNVSVGVLAVQARKELEVEIAGELFK